MIKQLIVAMLLGVASVSYGQSKQPIRVEVDLNDVENNYIIPAGNQGVVLLQEPDDADDNNSKKWSIFKYDTEFKLAYERNMQIPEDYSMVKYYYDVAAQAIYVLFSNYKMFPISDYHYVYDNYSLIKITIADGHTQTLNGTFPVATRIVDLKVVDDMAYYGGYKVWTKGKVTGRTCLTLMGCMIPMIFGSMSQKPVAVHYSASFKTKEIKSVIHDEYLGITRINDISANVSNKTVDMLVENVPAKKQYNITVLEFNNKGEQSNKIELPIDNTRSISNIHISTLPNNDRLVIGTYSTARRSYAIRGMANMETFGNQGLCFGKIENGKPKFLKFYNFTKFNNFFKFLDDKQQNRVERKVTRIEEKGKEALINVNLIVHDIIEQNGTFIMVAESYYPEYHYITTTSSDGKMRTERVFDGWRYTHAIVAGFNKDGELLWDNCFEIESILSKTLKERVKVLTQANGDLVLVYNFEGFLNSKVIRGNKVVSSERSEKIETNFPSDKIKEDFASDIDFWYDNYMIAYGMQKIKKKDAAKGEKKRRKVFYFNKISYK